MKNQLLNLGYIGIILLTAFLLFYKIDSHPIRIWDEAIYANNAVEMATKGGVLVLKNDDAINLYNTKPPLVIWLESLCIQLLGINELAIRLPSAFAVLLTVIALLFFSSQVLYLPAVGIIAGLTLIVSEGYFRIHVARTGDLDAVLTLFITSYTLLYFTLLLKKQSQQKDTLLIYCATLFFTLGFFSKSFAALLPLPGIFIVTLISPKRKVILTNRNLYIAAFLSMAVISVYYLTREYLGAGYLNKVYESEVKRLFYNVMPWHNQPFDFYFKNWYSKNFFYPFIYFLLIPPFFLCSKMVDAKVKKCLLYTLIWCLFYFLIISFPQVKLEWYDAPLYPFFSLLVGLAVIQSVKIFKEKDIKFFQMSVIVFTATIYIYALKNIVQKKIEVPKLQPQEYAGNFMRVLHEDKTIYNNYIVIYQTKWLEHQDQAKFYQKAYNIEDDFKISIVQYLSEISEQDIILTCQQNKIDSINAIYNNILLEEDANCKLLKIKEQE